jgi:hypothetical protein
MSKSKKGFFIVIKYKKGGGREAHSAQPGNIRPYALHL